MHNWRHYALIPPTLGAFAAIGIIVFAPGLTGGFAFDDFPNIVLNESVTITSATPAALFDAAFSIRSGPLYRPVSMVTLALNHVVSGLHPYGWKLANVLIHIAVALSVAALARLVFSAPSRAVPTASNGAATSAALACGLIFLVHPFNLTPALYVVQRMTSLCALFCVLSVCAYINARRADLSGSGPVSSFGWFAACVLFALLGLLSKEAAAALALLLPVTEATLFAFESRSRRFSQILRLGHAASVLAFAAAVLTVSGIATGAWEAKYAAREFSLPERLFTEGRVIVFYLGQTLLPRVTEMGLYHDDFRVSSGPFDPPSAIAAWVFIVAAVGAAVHWRGRFPLAAFGVLWYFAAHVLESTVVPLELVHEHRNYLPSAGLIIAATGYAAGALTRARVRVAVVAGVVPLLVLALATFSRAQTWSDPVTLALVEAEQSPDSARSVYRVAYAYHGLYLMNGDRRNLDEAIVWLEKAAEKDPTSVAPLFELTRIISIEGDEPPARYIDELRARLRDHRLQPAEIDYFRRLIPCLKQGLCRHDPNDVLGLFQAALSNEHLGRRYRAKVLFSLANFFVGIAGDSEAGVRVMSEVVELEPDDENNHLNYAKVLAMAGYPGKARKIADEIQERIGQRKFALPGDVTADDLASLREGIESGFGSPQPERG